MALIYRFLAAIMVVLGLVFLCGKGAVLIAGLLYASTGNRFQKQKCFFRMIRIT